MIRRVSSIGPYRGGFLATTFEDGAELGPDIITVLSAISKNYETESTDGWAVSGSFISAASEPGDGYSLCMTIDGASASVYRSVSSFLDFEEEKIYELRFRARFEGTGSARVHLGTSQNVPTVGTDAIDHADYREYVLYSNLAHVGGDPDIFALRNITGSPGSKLYVDDLVVREVIPTWRYR